MDFRTLALLAVVALLGLTVWRRFEGDENVRAVADETACGGHACEAKLEKSKRTLFGWELEYTTYGARAASVSVHCVRELWVFGEYDCHVATSNAAADERFR